MNTLNSAVDAFVRALRARFSLSGGRVTIETVQAVYARGEYGVRGMRLPTSGTAQLKVGDRVAVMWRGGQPVLILAHQARRAQFGSPPAARPSVIAEQLILYHNPANGKDEVWFRDGSRTVRIVDDAPPGAAGGLIHWGQGSANYFCLASGSGGQFAVYRLDRPEDDEPYPEGQDPTATLVKHYVLVSPPYSDVVFGTVDADHSLPLSATGDLKYNTLVLAEGTGAEADVQVSVTSSPRYGGITEDGELVVTVRVFGSGTGNNPTSGSGGELGSFAVNVDTSAVLANHVVASTTFNVYGSPSTPCQSFGTVTLTISPGVGSASDAGRIDVLSFKKVAGVSALNNYLLDGPSFIEFAAGCEAPTTAMITLRVVGQYAQTVGTHGYAALGDPRFRTQASRTRVLWAAYVAGTPDDLHMTDLAHQVDAIIGNDPDAIFEFHTDLFPLLLCAAADMVYAPGTNVAPYTDQFFAGGIDRTTGAITLTEADPEQDSTLDDLAPLDGIPEGTAEEVVLVGADSTDIHILNSPAVLGPLGLEGEGPA